MAEIFLHDIQGFGSHGTADIVLTDGVSSVTAGVYATAGLHSEPVWSDALGAYLMNLGGTVWRADISALTYGQISVFMTVTDADGNTAAASTVIDSDTTADEAGDLSVTVNPVVNDAESGNVTLTLSGVDADAVSVTVTLTDGTDSVSATAESDNNGAWTVDLSGGALKDGAVSAAVDMTDDAGNTASASTDSLHWIPLPMRRETCRSPWTL